MTENEAIEELKYDCNELGKAIPCDTSWGMSMNEAYNMAVRALQEIQQYRSIGTVSECREAMEKQRAKEYKLIHPCKSVNYYQCPVCDGLLHINENYCGNCGQRISWERDNE